MKKQEPQREAASASERPRKQRSRTFNCHAIPSSATFLTQDSTMHRSTNEPITNARHPSNSNASRTSQLGMSQKQQQHQLQQQLQARQQQALLQLQQPLQQPQRQRRGSSHLPRLSRIEEAIALSDSRPSSSNFIKRNTSSLSPGNSEIKPKPFVLEITNVALITTEDEIEQLLLQTVSTESFKVLKVFKTTPAKVIVRIESIVECNNLIRVLNGSQWKGRTLNVQLNLDATEKSSVPGDSNETFKPEFNRSYVPPQYRQPSLLRKNNSFYRSQKSTDSTAWSSFDSRRSTGRSSTISSHASSIFSSHGHRQSSNLSTISSDGLVSGKLSVPPLSIPERQQSEPSVDKTEEVGEGRNDIQQVEDQPDTNATNPIDGDLIEIPIGEGNNPEQLIKVCPTRLFVGNVPYTSNWASLRKFFIEKANELDPDNEISILRVEIPIQQMTLNEGLFYGQIGQPQIVSRSRGFAIVTTKDRASSEKLIELFNNVEFEGRPLTIRYDKFPQFNNYVIQQLHRGPRQNSAMYGRPYSSSDLTMNNDPSSPGYQQMPPPPPPPTQLLPGGQYIPQQVLSPYNAHQKFSTNPTGTSLLSNLAFERNLLQQKIYYGNPASQQQPPYSTNAPVIQPRPPPQPSAAQQPFMTQSQNPLPSSNSNQNVLASGYYFMPYYYQAPPSHPPTLPGSNAYQPQPYGIPVSATPSLVPVHVPFQAHSASTYNERHSVAAQDKVKVQSGNSGVNQDSPELRQLQQQQQQQQQPTSELFQKMTLNED